MRHALSISEHVYGASHPETGTCLNNLAMLLAGLGGAVEAEPLQRRALAISRRSCGMNHPDTRRCASNLVWIQKMLSER
ncbi:hypothetical protein HDF16_005181 [Granulicella aggregans]|uniref:Tetratricopeptide repeat protein n=1 Tax=Granulicella aggregans TaxID=474949 RepID=A0A7W7ZIA7_9BACT|nr:hypothetical protein [Granulicella aggregans]